MSLEELQERLLKKKELWIKENKYRGVYNNGKRRKRSIG